MEPENMNPNPPVETAAQPQAPEKHDGAVGPAVATLIILAVIILGGVYFWNQRNSDTLETADESSQIEAQSTSDAISEIEADLNATDLESLDAELDGIE